MGAVTNTGIYGPLGWTQQHNICDILGAQQEFIFGDPSFARFHDADATQLRVLAEVLPAQNFDDYQNASPVLGELMRACLRHPESVTVSGYVIGPPRTDERVTFDALRLTDNPVGAKLRARFQQDSAAHWMAVWNELAAYLGISASPENAPDELIVYRHEHSGSDYAWWMWWD